MVRFALAFLVSIAGFAYGAQFENLNAQAVPIASCSTGPRTGATRLQNEKHIIVAAWNVENVMENGMADGKPAPAWKFEGKQGKIARIGQDLNEPGSPLAHFIISPEIETLRAADHLFNSGPLAGKYRSVLIEGNDVRGIDIGFAIRADLDVTIEAETHKNVMWNDSTTGQKVRLFSRDLPVLIVKDRASSKVLIVLVGNHAKSKRDRPGDHESTQLRTAQYQAAKLIVQSYQTRYPTTPVLMAGDFNSDVRTGPEIAPIRALLKDSLDVSGATDRVTETYFPPNGGIVTSEMDAVFMTPATAKYVSKAQVLPEYDRVTGRVLGLPKTFDERERNFPSDHRAVAVVFETAVLGAK